MGIHAIEDVVRDILRRRYGITTTEQGSVATIASPVVTSPDIDGGTIDGVEITGELVDSTTFITDNADPTKTASFELAGITAGQNSVLTVPDADMTLMSTDTAQTVSGVKTFGAAGAVGKLKVAGTTSGAATIDAPAVAGTAVITLPAATSALATLALAESLTNKTLASPVLSGTVTGTYELAGTPTITGATLANPIQTGASLKGGAAGAAGTVADVSKTFQGTLTDNTATVAFVVTVPNAIHGGCIVITAAGMLGDGDSTDAKQYVIGISRITGAEAKAVVSSAAMVGATAGAGANATTTVDISAMSGGAGAPNLFDVRVTVARSAGASDNHNATLRAVCMNMLGTGITIAAA